MHLRRLILIPVLCGQVTLTPATPKPSPAFRKLLADVVAIKHDEAFAQTPISKFSSIEHYLMNSSIQKQISKLSIKEKQTFALLCIVYGNIFDGGPMGLLAESMGRDCAAIGDWLISIPSTRLVQEWQLSEERIRQVHNVGSSFQERR